MLPSRSEYFTINGLRYHVRRWGNPDAPTLLLSHGWMDVSATFQFMVDELKHEWNIIAPDWRGFGETQWANDAYWFPYYLADLDAILEQLIPTDEKVHMVGSSLGGNIVCSYAGVKPERVASVVSLEGFGVLDEDPEKAPQKIRKWLDQLQQREPNSEYADFDELAAKVQKQYPLATDERAMFVAKHWGVAQDGKVVLRADPAQKFSTPRPYRLDEVAAVMTTVKAPTLWVEGEESRFANFFKHDSYQERHAWFDNFSYKKLSAAGHLVHLDQPLQVAQLVEKHCLKAA